MRVRQIVSPRRSHSAISPEIIEQNKTKGTNEYSWYDICKELTVEAASGSAFKWAQLAANSTTVW